MTNYEKIMNGRIVYLGLDLSETNDNTSVSMVSVDEDNNILIKDSSCCHCAYNSKKFCGYECITGIRKWLKAKAKEEGGKNEI